MSSHVPYLPPDIVLVILSADNIDFTTLLRLTRVNKEWRSLIHDTNALRTKLFLPQRMPSGDRVTVGDDYYTPSAHASMVLDYKLDDRRPSATPTISLYKSQLELHPLLLPHRVEKHYLDDAFSLSYRLLRPLHNLCEERSTSWHHMCITSPPMRRLILTAQHIRCDSTKASSGAKLVIEKPSGITCGDLFEEIGNTNLKRNLGLIGDDQDCRGVTYPFTGDSEECLCYDTIGLPDRQWLKAETLWKDLEAKGVELRPLGGNDGISPGYFGTEKKVSASDMQEFAIMCAAESLARIEMGRASERAVKRKRSHYGHLLDYLGIGTL
ncbi:hypothetical protein HBI65_076510 [Parastagonospora nodorum]|nr:hypothetical protein HBI65_076510 [Parastagonospora nodorum]